MKRTGFTPEVRDLIIERDEYRCRRCSSSDSLEIHHRRGRGAGGTSKESINGPANGVLLCGDCHRWVESHRTEAYRSGWAIRRSDVDDEEMIPLTDLSGHVFFLNDDGSVFHFAIRKV